MVKFVLPHDDINSETPWVKVYLQRKKISWEGLNKPASNEVVARVADLAYTAMREVQPCQNNEAKAKVQRRRKTPRRDAKADATRRIGTAQDEAMVPGRRYTTRTGTSIRAEASQRAYTSTPARISSGRPRTFARKQSYQLGPNRHVRFQSRRLSVSSPSTPRGNSAREDVGRRPPSRTQSRTNSTH